LRYDVFAIQDEITEALAAAIEPQIYAVESLTAEKSAQQPRRLGPSHASGTDVLCGGECRVEPEGNAIIITKQASGTAKIDPLMTAFNAIALMSTNPWSTRPSIFII